MASYEQWYHGEKDEAGKQVKQFLTSLWRGSHYLKVHESLTWQVSWQLLIFYILHRRVLLDWD